MASLRPPPIPGERRQSQDGEQGKEDAREDGQDQGGEGHHEEGAHHVRSRCVARLLQRTCVCVCVLARVWVMAELSCGLMMVIFCYYFYYYRRCRHAVVEVDKDMLADEGDFDD